MKTAIAFPTARQQRKGKQNKNFARASNVFGYFFVVFARLRGQND